jgi:hypothetical protein
MFFAKDMRTESAVMCSAVSSPFAISFLGVEIQSGGVWGGGGGGGGGWGVASTRLIPAALPQPRLRGRGDAAKGPVTPC